MIARVFAVLGFIGMFMTIYVMAATKPHGADLFGTFEILDRQLTTLNAQLHYLEQDVESGRKLKTKQPEWRNTARQMRRTSLKVQRLSSQMQSHYRHQKRSLGVKMFGSLHAKAKLVNRRLKSLSQTRSKTVAQKELRKLQVATLNLVLAFQSVSGGYAASHCDAREWSCGVAKREASRQISGIKWTCVNRSNSCRGILGPRTPGVVAEPLTAATTKAN